MMFIVGIALIIIGIILLFIFSILIGTVGLCGEGDGLRRIISYLAIISIIIIIIGVCVMGYDGLILLGIL